MRKNVNEKVIMVSGNVFLSASETDCLIIRMN